MNGTGGLVESSKEYAWLLKPIEKRAVGLLEMEDPLASFTSHAVGHSQRVIEYIDELTANRVQLTAPEAFVLVGAAFLHDVAIACPRKALSKDQRERGWYETDLRLNHGAYSAWYVRSILFRELTRSAGGRAARIRENSDLLEGIALICHFHTAEEDIRRDCVPPSDRLRRLPLLAYLFVIADELEADYARVNIDSVLLSSIPAEAKRFWLLRASILSKRIDEARIIFRVIKPRGIDLERFTGTILRPLTAHLEAVLRRAGAVFAQFDIPALSVSFEVSTDTRRKTQRIRHEILDMDEDTAREERMIVQRESWARRLDKRTDAPGVLENHAIGDEFLVFRRWGSSTNRLLAGPSGLQRGGGYYLSWNGGGLCIDPGYDFIANVFGLQNLFFTTRDFNAALVTHAHDDHTADLEPLLSLEERSRRNRSPDDMTCYIFPIFCSEGVRWKYAPVAVADAFVQLFPLIPTSCAKRTCAVTPEGNSQTPFVSQVGLRIEAILSYHGELPWHLHHTGLTTKIYAADGDDSRFCLGYTGDTGYEPEIADFLRDADLVMLHVGDKAAPQAGRPNNHLGKAGCIDLISALNMYDRPKLFLLGEFGADEFIVHGKDERIDFTEEVEKWSGGLSLGKRVLPADIGLRVRLPQLEVWCEDKSVQGQPTADNPNGGWTPPSGVRPWLVGDGIHYTR